MINLTKNFEMKCREIPFFYNEVWITNGVFIVKRNKIKDSFKYCLNKPSVIQPELNRIIPESLGSIRVEKTDRLYEVCRGVYCFVFIDKDNREYLVNEKYVNHFSLDILYVQDLECGQSQGVLSNEDMSFFVMPFKR